jgi:large subunit ribosomal protein L30
VAENNIRVTLRKSLIGRLKGHVACAHGLGLKRIRQTSLVQDTKENRGMIKKIKYLLTVEGM